MIVYTLSIIAGGINTVTLAGAGKCFEISFAAVINTEKLCILLKCLAVIDIYIDMAYEGNLITYKCFELCMKLN